MIDSVVPSSAGPFTAGTIIDFKLTGQNLHTIPSTAYLSVFYTKDSALDNLDWPTDDPRFSAHYAYIISQSVTEIVFRLNPDTDVNYEIFPSLIVTHDTPREVLYELD